MRLSPANPCTNRHKKYIVISALRRNYIFRTQERRFCRGKSPIGELRTEMRRATREGVVIRHNRLTELDLTGTHGSTFVQRARSRLFIEKGKRMR